MTDGALEVAIVGFGPKGTYALERLLEHAHRTDRPIVAASPKPIRVTAYESGTPGCGPNYSPSQPPFLRMNFAASQLDAWPHDTTFVPGRERLNFVDWRARYSTPGGDDDFPPRAQVGRYLEWFLAKVLAYRSQRVGVKLVSERVRRVERVADGWLLASGASRWERFDEVIFCTGHRWSAPAPLPVTGRTVPCLAAFPVDALMHDRPLAPGTVVAIRGFALSFIDATLALTEGRGGAFTPAPLAKLRYVPSGREPSVIIPFSRSGLPMSAKQPPDRFRDSDAVEQAMASARVRILALPADFSVEADLMPLVGQLGDEIARSSGAHMPAPTADVRVMIERSIAIAYGWAPPDREACLGEAWRLAYPAVVERLGHGGLSDSEYPSCRRIATSMERIAFGPPPVNAAKLVALSDAGILCLDRTGTAPASGIDGRVDAVLPRPGADSGDPGPLGALIRAGVLTLQGRRGIRVDDSAHCLGADGRRVPGLACAGRPTEDWVIGNDTLSRSLHPDLDRWARAVIDTSMGRAAVDAAIHRLPSTGSDTPLEIAMPAVFPR